MPATLQTSHPAHLPQPGRFTRPAEAVSPVVPGVDRAGGFSPNTLRRIVEDPRRATPGGILALQRTYGNQAVQRLLKSQPKPAPARPTSPAPAPQVQRDDITQATPDADLAYAGLGKTEAQFRAHTKLVKPKVMYKSKSKSDSNIEARLPAGRLIEVLEQPRGNIFRKWAKIKAGKQEGFIITEGSAGTFKSADDIIGHKAAGVIMANTPTIEDVRQGMFGDCFLLAALMSLVRQNPAYVQTPGNLFQTNPATPQEKHKVRFFRINQARPSDRPTFTADTVEVNNTVLGAKEDFTKTDGSVKKAGNFGSSGTQPWPAILEKAFQVWGGKHGEDTLSGGQGFRASMYLTGEAYKSMSAGYIASELRGKTEEQKTRMTLDKKEAIIAAAGHGSIMTVSTPNGITQEWKDKNPGQAGGKGGSGEPIWGGILFKHVYELVSADADKVVIRNPWGHYSRVNGVINEEAAESVLNWEDFFMIASTISMKDAPAPDAPAPAGPGAPAPGTPTPAPVL